jgi:signal transduction histidine kinase
MPEIIPSIPLQINEEERLAALKSYNILDTGEEQDFDELTFLASAICDTPIALISLVDANRQWFKSHKGLDARETPVEQSFCAHAIVSYDDIMIVDDAKHDERFANNPLVTGETNITFYAGVPLVNEDGYALGSLCVIDHHKRALTDNQAAALKIIAKQVVDKLELRRKIALLEEFNQEIRDSNVFIQKFASTAAHDIKNPLSSILLTSQALQIRLGKLEDEGCKRLVDLNITATKNLVVLLDEMLAYSKKPSLLLTERKDVNLTDLLSKIRNLIKIPSNFEIHLPAEKHILNVSVVAMEQIFINLFTNAIRYNDKELGILRVTFSEDDDFYRFEVEDNGIGIAEQYHHKIFNNNFTLKTTDRYNQKGSGIGLSTVKELLTVLKGTIHLKSEVGSGTTFFISIKK